MISNFQCFFSRAARGTHFPESDLSTCVHKRKIFFCSGKKQIPGSCLFGKEFDYSSIRRLDDEIKSKCKSKNLKTLNANTLREKRECKSHNPNYPKYRLHYFTNVVTNYTISHKKRSFECRQKPIFSDHE